MRRNRKGYTLVELVVVLAVVGILLAAVVLSISAYSQYAKFKRENEYAKALFQAVQTQLTVESQLGTLSDLQDVTEGRLVPLASLDYGNGVGVDASDIWGTGESAYQGTIRYLMGTAADYQAYLAGTLPKTGDGAALTALYDLFDARLYNKSILNAAICVEFDPMEGLAYAVLYSDEAERFAYNTTTQDADCINDRTAETRKAEMIGYYGVTELSKSTSTEAEKPVISSVALSNEQTLNLSFRLSKVQEATMLLNYEVVVCDASDKTPLLSIAFNDATLCENPTLDTANYTLVASDSKHTTHTIQARVTRFSPSGASEDLGLSTFPAYVESDGTVRLVLDAVDLGATVDTYENGGLENTYSLHRFGITAESIYCTVQGSGSSYKTTAKKESNAQNPYFGSYTPQTELANRSYTIENVRHLYNVRFVECSDSEPATTYGVVGRVSWRSLIEAGAVYRAQSTLKSTSGLPWLSTDRAYCNLFVDDDLLLHTDDGAEATAFVSIYQLRAGSVLQAAGQTGTICDLTVLNTRNSSENVRYTSAGIGSATGLFLVNRGTIQNLVFDDLAVTGTDSVGTVCGVNEGSLASITVSNTDGSAAVTGTTNVGGVFGRHLGAQAQTVYSGLVNRASVTGQRYVGGIVGQLEATRQTEITLTDCRNYGKVIGTDSEAAYLGGITGLAQRAATGVLTLSGCVSSPQYEANALFNADKTALAVPLYGTYVGGVVGYNNGAEITACSTTAENGLAGYVLGDRYVGGIVGWNAGSLVGAGEVNQANVIGKTYVGGIVGQNGAGVAVENWTNQGVVFAFGDYAGGITGYNEGTLLDCGSDVDYDSFAQTLFAMADGGNYVGGIAGYNGGSISASSPLAVVTVTRGNNYVGGVVGFNDVEAELTDYELQGGYVTGNAFVGGFAGLNLSTKLIDEDVTIRANPNRVAGSYFVGGVFGGNIIAPTRDLTAHYEAYNILGSISGRAFVGGFAGYLCQANNKNQLQHIAEKLVDGLTDSLEENIALVEKRLGGPSDYVFTIEGNSVELRAITAELYVGGVVGYSDIKSNLYLKNITNRTPITATGVLYTGERGTADTAAYAYAGGVIGKVNDSIILENCANAGAGSVRSNATYTGGITELNAGLIVNCTAGSGGTGSTDNIGGVAGLNLASGTTDWFDADSAIGARFSGTRYVGATTGNGNKIRLSRGIFDCTLSGTITGRDHVGGLVAVNCGVIDNPVLSGALTGYGEAVGGVAGVNEAGGSIVLRSTLKISISGSGTEVGGVIGRNSGSLLVDASSEAATLTVTAGTIMGSETVGGVVGLQENTVQTLERLVNAAAVSASAGDAGGIVGRVGDLPDGKTFRIQSCVNLGSVQATLLGNAGGIVSHTAAGCTIERCWNAADVTAANGTGGGITGTNLGTLKTCATAPAMQSTQAGFWSALSSLLSSDWTRLNAILPSSGSALSVTGSSAAGGIVGQNQGTIDRCVAASLTVSNQTNSPANGSFGAIAGVNETGGTITLAAYAVDDASITVYTDACALGGVVGSNAGTVDGGVGSAVGDPTDVTRLRISISGSAATVGNFGGVAGVNSGSVLSCRVSASITGDKGTSALPENGYGGVSGINSGVLQDCTFDGRVFANGTVSAVSPTGGICGINAAGGSVTECLVGCKLETEILCGTSNAAYGYLGGAVGWNLGDVLGCDNFTGSKADSVQIIGYAGHVGGIVGFNDETGRISAEEESTLVRTSTGANWLVQSNYYSNDCGTGGIAGYSSSGYDLRYVDNHATVWNTSGASSNTAVGGIIGRLENRVLYQFRISHCNNYGAVWSSALSGGFIGRWKYLGGTMEYCANYGEIGVRPDEYASKTQSGTSTGLVASFYQVTADSHVQILSCSNYGYIYATGTASGLASAVNETTRFYLTLTDCINTGVIASGGTGGQFAGVVTFRSPAQVTVQRCRNYGNCSSRILSNFAGICHGNGTAARRIQDCYDESNAETTPIADRAPSVESGNYYVCPDEVAEPTGITVTASLCSFSGTAGFGSVADRASDGNGFSATIDGDPTTRCSVAYSNTSYTLSRAKNNPITLTYTLTEASALGGFGIKWCNNGTTSAAGTGTCRQYVYRLYYRTSAGDRVEITSPDSAGGRSTYSDSVGAYVENGYSKNEVENFYYHAFTAQNVTAIEVVVLEVNSVSGDANARAAGDGVIWTKSACNNQAVSNNAYICIFDVYAADAAATSTEVVANPVDYLLKPVMQSGVSTQPKVGLPLVVRETGSQYALYDAQGLLTSLTGLTRSPIGRGSGRTEFGASDTALRATQDFSDYQDYTGNLAGLSFRYQLIGEIEPKLLAARQQEYTTELPISDLTATDIGQAYAITWSTDEPAWLYEISYAVSGLAECGDTIYDSGECYAALDVNDDWGGRDLTVYVRSVYWQATAGGYVKAYSEWQASPVMTVRKALPMPQVHLELIGTSANSYLAVLDNWADYVDGEGQPLNATISYTVGAVTTSFTVSQRQSSRMTLTASGNQTFTVQALATTLTASQQERYTKSLRRSTQSALYPISLLQSTNYCNTTFVGFYGATTDGLSYLLRLNKNNTTVEMYFYTELLTYDAALDTYVVRSRGESHVTGQGLEMTATLSGLNDDLTTTDGEIVVRTYPWRTQGFQTYFGHEVAAAASAAELHTLTDGGAPIWTAAGGFGAGYVISSNGDGTYRVIYSAILANDVFFAKQIDRTTYSVNTAAHTVTPSSGSASAIRPAPVIDAQYDYNPATDSYTFAWDSGIAASDASYNVTLVGISADGTEVALASFRTTSENYDAAGRRYVASFLDESWNYPNLRLKIDRLGQTSSAGQTTVFPAQSLRVFNLKIRLSQIPVPNVSFHEDESGIVEKDDLIYDVTWTGLSDSLERAELDQYAITVRYTDGNGETQEVEFYTGDRAASLNEVLVSDLPLIYAASDTATTATINLNCLAAYGGTAAEISVRAIATESATTYRSGADGVARVITLPTRVQTPNLENLVYVAGAVVSVSRFESTGVSFRMAQDYTEKGSYEMTAEIVRRTQDGYEHVADVLNGSGQAISPDNPIVMTGGLANGMCTLTGISADYAGLYVKVALRAVSESSISSIWTFADASGMQYAYFRLPMVQLNTPSVTESTRTIVYTNGSADEVDWDRLDQTALSFACVDYAAAYELNLVQTPVSVDLNPDEDHRTAYTAALRLEQSGSGFEVFYQAAEDETYRDGWHLLGTLGAGGSLILPYAVTVGTGSDELTLTSQLFCEAGTDGLLLTLVLPDCASEAVRQTRTLTVQAMAADSENYTDSILSSWQRTTIGQLETTTLQTVSPAAAPSLTAEQLGVTASERSGICCELTYTGTSRIDVQVCAGDVTRVYSAPGVTRGASVSTCLPLPEIPWAAYVGGEVTVSIRTVTDGTGVSAWSEPVTISIPATP